MLPCLPGPCHAALLINTLRAVYMWLTLIGLQTHVKPIKYDLHHGERAAHMQQLGPGDTNQAHTVYLHAHGDFTSDRAVSRYWGPSAKRDMGLPFSFSDYWGAPPSGEILIAVSFDPHNVFIAVI